MEKRESSILLKYSVLFYCVMRENLWSNVKRNYMNIFYWKWYEEKGREMTRLKILLNVCVYIRRQWKKRKEENDLNILKYLLKEEEREIQYQCIINLDNVWKENYESISMWREEKINIWREICVSEIYVNNDWENEMKILKRALLWRRRKPSEESY